MDYPPYTFLPGYWPHPHRDPEGHRFALEPSLSAQELLKQGCELLDRGYYWEAHEAFERLCVRSDRTSAEANLLRALIKMAASCIKYRQGYERAYRSLGGAAERHLETSRMANLSIPYSGVELEKARSAAAHLSSGEIGVSADPGLPVQRILDMSLWRRNR